MFGRALISMKFRARGRPVRWTPPLAKPAWKSLLRLESSRYFELLSGIRCHTAWCALRQNIWLLLLNCSIHNWTRVLNVRCLTFLRAHSFRESLRMHYTIFRKCASTRVDVFWWHGCTRQSMTQARAATGPCKETDCCKVTNKSANHPRNSKATGVHKPGVHYFIGLPGLILSRLCWYFFLASTRSEPSNASSYEPWRLLRLCICVRGLPNQRLQYTTQLNTKCTSATHTFEQRSTSGVEQRCKGI